MEKRNSRKKNKIRKTWLANSRTERGRRGIRRQFTEIIYPIPIYIKQDAALHSLFYLETVLHVSGGTSTHYQGRIQLYLQHLVFVRPLLLSASIGAGSSNGLTNTRCYRYSCMRP